MAEELQAIEGTSVPEELSTTQKEALAQGWVPKEDFDGDPEKWVEAGEFIRRGELFRKIESQSKELKDVKKALGELAKHNSKIREIEYQRALDALKAEKRIALSEGDSDRVVDLDDKIDLVKTQQRQDQQQAVQQAVPQEIHPEFRNWMGRNGWYETTPSMRGWADARGIELANEGRSPSEVLQTLEKEVKIRFSEKFHNPKRDKPGAVESPVRQQKAQNADIELSDIEKQVMNTLIRQGVMTKEKYMADLKAIKAKN